MFPIFSGFGNVKSAAAAADLHTQGSVPGGGLAWPVACGRLFEARTPALDPTHLPTYSQVPYDTSSEGIIVAAELVVLHEGYVGADGVASSVVLVRDDASIVVIDPGMVRHRRLILDPLAAAGIRPDDVTDIVLSHHHPDHTWHLALFPTPRVHDFWAIYQGDQWNDSPAEGRQVSPHVRLIETPGHTPQDITTLVSTADGLIACTHLWWNAAGPPEDPRATDPEELHAGRRRVLDLGVVRVVPGHGPAFVPGASTPS
jgi:glyoxylase-like metal-dependent hydrolase (beta-lactamase superfamily II)